MTWQAILGKNCGQFAENAIRFLHHLIEDIDLARRITNWDLNILGDVFALIGFLKACCGARNELVSSLEKYCTELDELDEPAAELATEQGTEQGNIMNTKKDKKKKKKKMPAATFTMKGEKKKSYPETLSELKDLCKFADHESASLLEHLKSGSSNVKGDDIDNLVANTSVGEKNKIPTATLRELFILNEAYCKRGEIWSQVESKLRQPNARGGDFETSDLSIDDAEIFRSIFSKFQTTTAPDKGKEDPKIARDKIAWLSRTIVLVLDMENRIILTGGTQPTCHDSALFGEVVEAIKHLRIGEEFAETINNCSKDFAERANAAKEWAGVEDTIQVSRLTDPKIEKLYEEVVDGNESDWWDKIPAATKDKLILS